MPKAAHPTRHRDQWRIRWIDHSGKRRSALFVTHAEAEAELARRQSDARSVRSGRAPAPPPDKRFDELADYWLVNRGDKRSIADDRSIIGRLRLTFGGTQLRLIGREQIDGYQRAQETRGLSPKTIANHLVLLGSMLRLAAELGWILQSPTIKKPRTDPDGEFDPPWLKSQNDVRRFLDAARAEPDPAVFAMYTTAVYTGMRAGELAGLRWADVDLDRRTIHVRRSYDGRTKTRASRRHVPLVDALLPVLCEQHSQRTGELVFPNAAGQMHDPSARIFQETLHRVLDRAGFERPTEGRSKHVIHFHSLRHTFACHWRLNGGPLEDLIRVLGHTSKSMTEHYANVGGYHRPEHFAIFAADAP
jgi:integrase